MIVFFKVFLHTACDTGDRLREIFEDELLDSVCYHPTDLCVATAASICCKTPVCLCAYKHWRLDV